MKAENLSFDLLKKDAALKDKLIYTLEDDEDILKLIEVNLEKAGFNSKTFIRPQLFIDELNKKLPDLIILDLMLPEIDGYDVIKYLKSKENFASIPIIILTAKADEVDKLIGFELGTDDYITKPFSPRELIARIKAVLNRSFFQSKTRVIKVGKRITIDLNRYEVTVDNKVINLTTTEFKILLLFSKNIGRVFSREQILNFIDDDKVVLDRTIDVHIKNLRDKLGKAGALIKNKRGLGYKIDEEV